MIVCECGAELIGHSGTFRTLVGYARHGEHVHDNNCLKRVYKCAKGHGVLISVRPRCPKAGCDWRGRRRNTRSR